MSEASGCYGLDGRPIGLAEASRLLADIEARRIAVTHVGPWRVSTVFLVVDHRHDDGPPVLWETMVSAGTYRSAEAARAGHELVAGRLLAEWTSIGGPQA